MRDGTPPRSSRSPRDPNYPRGGDPGASNRRIPNPNAQYPRPGGYGNAGASGRMPNPNASSRMPAPGRADFQPEDDPYNPYDPYSPYEANASARMPTLGATRYGAAVGRQEEMWTSARIQAVQQHRHRIGIAIFHDGNPGHLWRGAISSRFGETILGAGIIMWLAALYQSPVAVALALLALGLPFLLVGPLGARLENTERPDVPLKWLSRLCIVLSLGLIVMHFRTILVIVYALLFLLSFCGRLRDAARVGAIRTCLAPGEPEHFANDIYVGGAVAAVLGPILATLTYILLGERILLVAIVAAVAFVIAANSDGFLDVLPPGRRAFLLATPETLYPNGDVPALAHTDGEGAEVEDEAWREEALPPWYQQGPTSAVQASGELRIGLGLAGSSSAATVALWGLCALAIAGGALSALLVFYVTDALLLPPFYLGPLLAAEGAGLALGSLAVASEIITRARGWQVTFVFGLVATGVLLAALVILPQLLIALALMLLLGMMTALAVSGARLALYAGFDPVEQRSITTAENWVVAFGSLIGVALVVLFLSEETIAPTAPQLPIKLHGWPLPQLLLLLGIGLIVTTGILMAMMVTGNKQPKSAKSPKNGKKSGKGPVSVQFDERGEWGDGDAGDDGWGDSEEGFAASAQYSSYGDTGYTTGYSAGYEASDEWDADNDSDDQPSTRYPRRPGNQQRPRW